METQPNGLTATAFTAHGPTLDSMPVTVQFDLPEDVFSALRATPEAFVSELRIAAAVKWYEAGRVSQGKAAGVAGVSRQAFHDALSRYGVSAFQTTPDELRAA